MAQPILRNTTIIGVKQESTEGTYVAPAANTDYIQPLEDGFEMVPSKELVERNVLDSSIGVTQPRTGLRGVTAQLPVEMRGSGIEGATPDFDLLLKGALGNSRQIAARVTTGTGHTSTVIDLDASSVLNFAVGDFIVILQTGNHHACFVSAVNVGAGTEAITITPAAPFTPSNGVEISKSTTYYPANSGHIPLSLSYYWGNEKRQAGIGCKVTSMNLENFTTGQLASWNFGLEGMTFSEIDGVAPHTPSFDSGLPPIILSACVYRAGTELQLNEFSLSLANEISFMTATCDADGKVSSRIVKREINGTMNPYTDDSSLTDFTNYSADTLFSLVARAFVPSSTAGEYTLGSVCGIYMPNCMILEYQHGDKDGLVTDEIGFRATRGASGSLDEIFVGVV